VALLTNGTLFYRADIRGQILDVDIAIASLDAASEKNFIRINRPSPGLKISQVIDGLVSFRKQFANQFWVEIFIVPGFNDSESELAKIRDALKIINPDRIQLNTLDRPGTESWVKPASKKVLIDIASYLYDADIIKYFPSDQPSDKVDKVCMADIRQSIISTIKRRPCTAEDVSHVLGLHINEANKHLSALVENGEIEKKMMPRGIFYVTRP